MAPEIIAYLLKLSFSLAVVFLFYRLVLQHLTFYTWNRWYLLGFTALSYVIPLVDVAPLWAGEAVAPLPAMTYYFPPVESFEAAGPGPASPLISGWEALLLVLLAGSGAMLLRTAIQVFSFLRLRRKAQLLSDREARLYQVEADILPFSFGRSVFLNPALHREQDLPEIIRHELVHVQQGHTADLLWMELVCILNWFNPFAWLLRRQVRENLEFIADRQVLQTGIDKKHYQYLLLQVTAGPAFSLANPFNFSPLKKRIMMMNKMPSTRYQLAWFLVLLPLVSGLLLAFRGADQPAPANGQARFSQAAREKAVADKQQEKSKSRQAKSQEAQRKSREQAVVSGKNQVSPQHPAPDAFKLFLQRNPQVKGLQWTQEDEVIIHLKSGDKETFQLKDAASLAALEQKYGKLPPPPPPPPAPPVPKMVPPPPPVPPVGEKLPAEGQKPAPPAAPAIPEKPTPPSLGCEGRGKQTNYFTYLA